VCRQTEQQDSAKSQYELLVFRHLMIPGEYDRLPIVDFPVAKGLDDLNISVASSIRMML